MLVMPIPKSPHKHNKENCRKYVGKLIKHNKRKHEQSQAIAISLNEARARGCGKFIKKRF